MLKHFKEDFKKEVLESEKVTLVDFFAQWCGPCKMLSPVLEEIAKETDKFDIVKIDIDQNRDLAIDSEVEVVPTMVLFKNGKPVERVEGLISKSQILELVNKHI